MTLMDYNSKHAFLLSSVKGQCYDVYCFLKDFHQLSQNLLLWLASAESRRQKAHVTDPQAGPRVLLECQEELRVSFFLSVSALARASVQSALSPAWCFWEEQCQCAVLPHASGCPLGIPLWSCSRGTGRDEELCGQEQGVFKTQELGTKVVSHILRDSRPFEVTFFPR